MAAAARIDVIKNRARVHVRMLSFMYVTSTFVRTQSKSHIVSEEIRVYLGVLPVESENFALHGLFQ